MHAGDAITAIPRYTGAFPRLAANLAAVPQLPPHVCCRREHFANSEPMIAFEYNLATVRNAERRTAAVPPPSQWREPRNGG